MKNLYLMRHGIAARTNNTQDDFDIPLTPEGIHLLEAQTLGMRKLGVKPQIIIASPYKRAQETAALVAHALNPELKETIETTEDLVPYSSPQNVFATLSAYQEFESVLVVSHQPLMGSTAGSLVKGRGSHLPFGKGCLCLIEVEETPKTGKGSLQWLLTPQQQVEAVQTR